jgi:hypothetical protein
VKQRIGVLSDPHYGGVDSLCPPVHFNRDGSEYHANAKQRWMWDKYQILKDAFNADGGLDALLLLGDLVDGSNPKRHGRGMFIPAREDQEDGFIDNVLEPINFRELYNIEGSRYHIGMDTSSDKRIITNMLDKDPSLRGGFDYDAIIDVEDVGIYMRHSCGVSGQYPGTPLWREMKGHAMNIDQFGPASIFLFGHAHYYFHVTDKKRHAFNCPCFKGRDAFTKSLSTGTAFTPSIGGLIFEIEGDSIHVNEDYIWKLPSDHTIKRFRVGE